MISDRCRSILERHIEMKGRGQVVRELGISPAALSQILNDNYKAATDTIEAKIMGIYGNDGTIKCHVLGEIKPGLCADNYDKAQKIKSPGNPRTIRLYIACRNCNLRG